MVLLVQVLGSTMPRWMVRSKNKFNTTDPFYSYNQKYPFSLQVWSLASSASSGILSHDLHHAVRRLLQPLRYITSTLNLVCTNYIMCLFEPDLIEKLENASEAFGFFLSFEGQNYLDNYIGITYLKQQHLSLTKLTDTSSPYFEVIKQITRCLIKSYNLTL